MYLPLQACSRLATIEKPAYCVSRSPFWRNRHSPIWLETTQKTVSWLRQTASTEVGHATDAVECWASIWVSRPNEKRAVCIAHRLGMGMNDRMARRWSSKTLTRWFEEMGEWRQCGVWRSHRRSYRRRSARTLTTSRTPVLHLNTDRPSQTAYRLKRSRRQGEMISRITERFGHDETGEVWMACIVSIGASNISVVSENSTTEGDALIANTELEIACKCMLSAVYIQHASRNPRFYSQSRLTIQNVNMRGVRGSLSDWGRSFAVTGQPDAIKGQWDILDENETEHKQKHEANSLQKRPGSHLEPDRSTENRFMARNIAHKMIFSRNSGVAEETNDGARGVVDWFWSCHVTMSVKVFTRYTARYLGTLWLCARWHRR